MTQLQISRDFPASYSDKDSRDNSEISLRYEEITENSALILQFNIVGLMDKYFSIDRLNSGYKTLY